MSNDYRKYQQTTWSVERSQAEIQKELMKYGGDGFQLTTFKDKVEMRFLYKKLCFLFAVPLSEDPKEDKRIFRLVHQYIYNLLDMVKEELIPFEQAFIGNIEIKRGLTLADNAIKQLDEAVSSGKLELLAQF